MKVKLVGKAHREGTSSKTGRDYCINVLHCLGNGRGVEGQAVMTVTVDGREHPYENLRIGGDYIVDYDSNGSLVDFQPVNSGAGNR